MPDLPTRNNLYRHNVLYVVLEQLRAVGEAITENDLPDLLSDERNNPSDFEIGYEIARQLKHIADNISDNLVSTFLASFPTADVEDGVTIWNDEGTLKVSTNG